MSSISARSKNSVSVGPGISDVIVTLDSESEGVTRAYRLLRDAIANTGQVAIGRVVLRSKECLVAVRERDELLSLTTMLFADEMARGRAF